MGLEPPQRSFSCPYRASPDTSPSSDNETRQLEGDLLLEFHGLRSELYAIQPTLTHLFTPTTYKLPAPLIHDITKLHVTYHGTTILLYNIAVILFETGNGVKGIELEEARRRTLNASDALVEIATLVKQRPNSVGYERQVVLYVSFQRLLFERGLIGSLLFSSFTLLTQLESTSENSSDPPSDLIRAFLPNTVTRCQH